jgi:ubiquinone/menaquinone biosynthesis C-methylase UbiE
MTGIRDPKVVKNFYYKNPSRLTTRLDAWKLHGTNPMGYHEWVYSCLNELNHDSAFMLDVGCGTGSLLKLAASKNKSIRLAGLDMSYSLIKSIRSKFMNEITFKVGDANCMPFGDEQFDVVTATHVLHHIAKPVNVLKEMKRVTKDGGVVFVTSFDPKLDRSLNLIHYRALDALNFPKFMKDKSEYTKFVPSEAEKAMRNVFKRIKKYSYRNDLIFTDVNSCMKYYESGMMYRNSSGLRDKRVTQKMWDSLYEEVKRRVSISMARYGEIVFPGVVVGFKAQK